MKIIDSLKGIDQPFHSPVQRDLSIRVEIMTVPVEYRTIETEVRLPYRLALGATWTRFFEGLTRKIIYGSRCAKCKEFLFPPDRFAHDVL